MKKLGYHFMWRNWRAATNSSRQWQETGTVYPLLIRLSLPVSWYGLEESVEHGEMV